MKKSLDGRIFRFGTVMVVCLALAACQVSPTLILTTPIPTRMGAAIYAYASSTPTLTLMPPKQDPTSTPAPLPTATPFLYTVKVDDTLLAIAFRFGITLQALKAANPDVNPNIMSVGQVLVIPISSQLVVNEATDLPLDLRLGEPDCYPAGLQSIGCLIMVENMSSQFALNVKIEVAAPGNSLSGGEVRQTVSPLLDRLPPGASLPVEVFLEGIDLEKLTEVQSRLLSAQSGQEDDSRYWSATILEEAIQITEDKKSAYIRGEVQSLGPASQIRLVAVSYQAKTNQPVGLKRWDITNPCPDILNGSSAAVCGPISFNFAIYSLGPDIDRVEIFVEALR